MSRGVLAAGLPSNVARTEVMREAKGGAKNGKKIHLGLFLDGRRLLCVAG